MKFILISGVIMLMVVFTYFLGPKIVFDPLVSPKVDAWNISLDSLDKYVKEKDQHLLHLKPHNESRIYWADDSLKKTRYSVVYLHGFSASPLESNPTHIEFANKMGFNLYTPLLSGHGLDDPESFLNLQPNDMILSAKEAVAIGQLLGDDVIVMSCSTGGTLSIYLAGANPEMIDVLIMYSPNLALHDPRARLVTGPWGKEILNVLAGEYHFPAPEDTREVAKYWTTNYRMEGVMALQKLLDDTMTPEVFKAIKQPYFVGYYYKDPIEQDQVVSIESIFSFDKQTSTPLKERKMIAFPNAGSHVMTNPLRSDDWETVLDSTMVFARNILK